MSEKLTSQLSRPTADVRYADSGGEGRSVILSHGAGLDHTIFDVQANALRQAGYRTIVWDMRGHGESGLDADTRFTAADALGDLAALVDELHLGRPVLVGHSLGGNLSQAFVRKYPERASGLIVVDSTWNTGPLSGLERLGLRMAAPMLSLIPFRLLPGLMARASAVSTEAVAQTASIFAAMSKRVFLDVWRATATLVTPDEPYHTPVPLGLVRGAQDRTGNISAAMPRWAQAEGVQEHIIPDAGHIVTLDAPKAVAQALLHVLEKWDLDGAPAPPSHGG